MSGEWTFTKLFPSELLAKHTRYITISIYNIRERNSFIFRFALAATLSSNYGVYGPAYEFYENTPMEGKEEYFNSENTKFAIYDWSAPIV